MAREPRVFVFGEGSIIVAHTVAAGVPAICIVETDEGDREEAGTPVDHYTQKMKDEGVLLVFPTAESIHGLLDLITKSVTNWRDDAMAEHAAAQAAAKDTDAA